MTGAILLTIVVLLFILGVILLFRFKDVKLQAKWFGGGVSHGG